MELFELGGHRPRSGGEDLPGRGRADAARVALQQGHSEGALQLLDAVAGGGRGEVAALRAAGQGARLDDREEEAQIGQGVVHVFVTDEGLLENIPIVRVGPPMRYC